MTLTSTYRGLAMGVGILLSQQLLYLVVLSGVPFAGRLRYALIIAPAVAAFVAAHWAVKNKLLVGMLIAPLGVGIAMVAARIYGELGFSIDSLGSLTDEILFLLTFYTISSGCGTLLALVVGSKRQAPASKTSQG